MRNGKDTLVQEHRCAATDDANEQSHEEDDLRLQNRVISQQVGELGGNKPSEFLRGVKPKHEQSSPFFSICNLQGLISS
jgi:hypothetical protein